MQENREIEVLGCSTLLAYADDIVIVGEHPVPFQNLSIYQFYFEQIKNFNIQVII